MTIAEIYKKFDKIGCLSFATINEDGDPESRIAHLRGYDADGIYFMTMYTKSFYQHLMANNKISVCGLGANTVVQHDEEGMPLFDNGYAIRMTGVVKEISINELKAKNNPIFDLCIKDHEKYPAMVVFCISAARGDVFDYDFELTNREHKLERIYFSYGGASKKYRGLVILTEKCIACGVCKEKCSFLAIDEEAGVYKINRTHCDECGDCYLHCPVKAISYSKEIDNYA